MLESQIISCSQLNELNHHLEKKYCLLIYDRHLQKKYGAWIRSFPMRIALKSGEQAKTLQTLSVVLNQLRSLLAGVSTEQLRIISFGGGSIGDFSGFLASVYRRGVKFHHVPSTWLSAMDSAHGGKTALNVAGAKNQIGTFYSAEKIFLVKKVLLSQPDTRFQEAKGEFFKMALLMGGKLWKKAPRISSAGELWFTLPLLIQGKMKIVKQDPFEKKGLRHLLNLGHTVGHVLEAELGIPHGTAVHYGLCFSYHFGQRLGLTRKNRECDKILSLNPKLSLLLRQVKDPKSKLALDKKVTTKARIRFVFFQKPGKAIIRSIRIADLVKEWKRQCRN